MRSPSELFNDVKKVTEIVEETVVEDKKILEEEITQSVSLLDGAFRNIQDQILESNKKDLAPFKEQVLEVYNICSDIAENQLPKYKKDILRSDVRTESKIKELKEKFYNTLEERIAETKETIQVFFREEVKEVNKLRANVVVVEKYIKDTASDIITLREDVFQELKKHDKDSVVKEASINNIQRKLDAVGKEYETLSEELKRASIDYDRKLLEISKEYETLTEGLLNEPSNTDNSDPETPLDKSFATIEQLQSHYRVFVNRVQQQLSTIGGGGETKLAFLDDLDRSTALVDGKFLKYDAASGKFVGATGGGGAGSQTLNETLGLGNTSSLGMSVGLTTASELHVGIDTGFFTEDLVVNGDARITGILTIGRSSITLNGNDDTISATSFVGDGSGLSGIVTITGSGSVGEILQHDGSSFVGIASTGFRDYVINQGQGYYAYTTDYYTVGVANTTQEIEEGVWTLLQPQVAGTGLYNHQPACMDVANSGDPWVGSGATIGTGQTEFSLAGTKPGTMCLVRTLIRFEPDTDETDLDLRLHFTTNTATQATGLTNFNTEKQALVMTTGAGVTYSSEEIISFFVGDTLFGNTKADAGTFCIEANSTTDGTLEIQGVTVMIDI